ncbi:MAG: hypothetical protein R2762_30550 [Bryobacteraceae bacterium]
MITFPRSFASLLLAGALLLSTVARAKEPKNAKAAPLGLRAPGVAVPYANLKSEADFMVSPPLGGVLLTDSIAVADGAGVHRFDAKTNKPFEPSRDVLKVKNACGGIVSAFSFAWAAICDSESVVKIEIPPVRPAGRRGGRKAGESRKAAAAPDGEKTPEAGKAEPEGKAEGVKVAEDAKPSEAGKASEDAAKADATPPPPAPRKPPAEPVFIAAGSTPVAAQAIASTADSVWLLADGKTSLLRVDPVENTVVSELRLPPGCQSIVFAEKSLWVACPGASRILRINPDKNLVEKRIEAGAEPIAIAAGESSIWVLLRKDGKVVRIDPKTEKVTASIDLGLPGLEGMLAYGVGSVWASTPGFPITRIDPESDKVAQQFHGEGGGRIYFGLGSVWVGGVQSPRLRRFDPKLIKATLSD